MLQIALLSFLIACSNITVSPIVFCELNHNGANRKGAQKEIHSLEQGSPLEVEMARGGAHRYRVALKSGQYLRVVVEQKGIEIALALLGADSNTVAEQPSAKI